MKRDKPALLASAAGVAPVIWVGFGVCALVLIVILMLGHETRGKPMVELEHAA